MPFGRVPYYCRLGLYYRNADSILESAQTLSQWTGLLREWSPGPLAPEARIMPLDQAAIDNCRTTLVLSAQNFTCCAALMLVGTILTKATCAPVRCSIVVSISACHAEDPGSIPGGGDFPAASCSMWCVNTQQKPRPAPIFWGAWPLAAISLSVEVCAIAVSQWSHSSAG